MSSGSHLLPLQLQGFNGLFWPPKALHQTCTNPHTDIPTHITKTTMLKRKKEKKSQETRVANCEWGLSFLGHVPWASLLVHGFSRGLKHGIHAVPSSPKLVTFPPLLFSRPSLMSTPLRSVYRSPSSAPSLHTEQRSHRLPLCRLFSQSHGDTTTVS